VATAEITAVPLAFSAKAFGRVACSDEEQHHQACCAAGAVGDPSTTCPAGNPYTNRTALAQLVCTYPCAGTGWQQLMHLTSRKHSVLGLGGAIWRSLPDYSWWVGGRRRRAVAI
jgi:hypothetical protein